jgi:Domain of unknown function (DUF4281)
MGPSWRTELIPIFGEYNAEDIFPITNIILPAWILLIFAPKWSYTEIIVWIPIILNALLYVISVLTILSTGGNDGRFDSLEGIVQLFRDPNAIFAGWLHYLSFDLFVGRSISLDALEHKPSYFQYVALIGPCLFLCLMFGPSSLLLYASIKFLVLKKKDKEKEN